MVSRRLCAIALIVCAVLLLRDASTYGLLPADGHGRVRGCYTAIELLVGVKEPSAIRPGEFVGALVLGAIAMLLLRRTPHVSAMTGKRS